MKHSWRKYLIACVLCGLLCWGLKVFFADAPPLNVAFESLQEGMTEDQVETILGKSITVDFAPSDHIPVVDKPTGLYLQQLKLEGATERMWDSQEGYVWVLFDKDGRLKQKAYSPYAPSQTTVFQRMEGFFRRRLARQP